MTGTLGCAASTKAFASDSIATGTSTSNDTPNRATRALAAADVMASFEALQLLLQDQGLPQPEAVSAMAGALVAILTPAPRISAD